MSDLGERSLQREIESDRRSERVLVWKAALALLIVAALVVVRAVFFA